MDAPSLIEESVNPLSLAGAILLDIFGCREVPFATAYSYFAF